jgi:serine/threonine protein kinase
VHLEAVPTHAKQHESHMCLRLLQEQEECIKETQILSSLDSEYIIKYYDSFLDKVQQQQQRRQHGQRCRPRHESCM